MAKSNKLPKLIFMVEQMPGCCGIGVVHNFREEESGYCWLTDKNIRVKRIFDTKEEQAEECYKRLLEKTCDGREYFSQLLISLVSHYREKEDEDDVQLPELQDILIREGWTLYSVFINPNHGNEVTLFGKYFPERVLNSGEQVELAINE